MRGRTRPDEMLEILKIADHLQPCPTIRDSAERRERMAAHREEVVRAVLKNSASASQRFARAWRRLPPSVTQETLAALWLAEPMQKARGELQRLARRAGALSASEIDTVVERAVEGADPNVRQLLREALRLFAYNSDLSRELGCVVVRQQARTELVGQ